MVNRQRRVANEEIKSTGKKSNTSGFNKFATLDLIDGDQVQENRDIVKVTTLHTSGTQGNNRSSDRMKTSLVKQKSALVSSGSLIKKPKSNQTTSLVEGSRGHVSQQNLVLGHPLVNTPKDKEQFENLARGVNGQDSTKAGFSVQTAKNILSWCTL